MKYTYKETYPLDARKLEGEKVRQKYPDRVPIIVEKHPDSSLPQIRQKKFLVPTELTVGQFHFLVKKRIGLTPDQPLYLYINNAIAPTLATMRAMYQEHHDEDLLLYVTYSDKNFNEDAK